MSKETHKPIDYSHNLHFPHGWQEIGKSFKAANMDLLATDEDYVVPLTSEK